MVDEARRCLFRRLRQSDPGLDAEQPVGVVARSLAGALRMRDASAGGHPVHIARHDRLA